MTMFNMITQSLWEKARGHTFWTKEPETVAWIKEFTEQINSTDAIFWDIGANVGIYSLYCSYKYPKIKVHAFEPHKANFIRLWQNILLNDFINITAYYAAVGNQHKLTTFNPGDSTVGTSGGQAGTDNGYPVAMITGDYMTERARAAPNYIKIDTDGNEYDVLCGMKKTLNQVEVKSVLVEVNSHKLEILELMADAGFVVNRDLMDLIDRPNFDKNIIFSRIY